MSLKGLTLYSFSFKQGVLALLAISMLAASSAQAKISQEQYDVALKENQQQSSRLLNVYQDADEQGNHHRIIFEYEQEGSQRQVKEIFERGRGAYMAQGHDFNTYISEKPVYHFKDLQVLLATQVASGHCYSSKSTISVSNEAIFYGDALLLSRPERAISITHQCKNKRHHFDVLFNGGSSSLVMFDGKGNLERIISRYKDKTQSVVMRPQQKLVVG